MSTWRINERDILSFKKNYHLGKIILLAIVISSLFLLSSCGDTIWNNPYSQNDTQQNVLYSVFSERPKHLDPVQSYSSSEIQFTAQIYEPPLQYHYLRRPFTLIPSTATALPTVQYLDKDGNFLSADETSEKIAYSVYQISILPGVLYQPHPAFAKDGQDRWRYHQLSEQEIANISTPADFAHTGARELTADDYVYQIKRLAHPRLHSPILELMADYIVGLREYTKVLKQADSDTLPNNYLDLRKHPLAGAEVVDSYTYRIKIKGKYPQFAYWLAMPFFAPIPWEVDLLYSHPGLIKKNVTLDWYPVGTGPYMLTENNPNLRMVLEKNPNFHEERYPMDGMPGDKEKGLLGDAGKKLPLIDKVIFTREKENIPRWNKFLQGYYDAAGIGSDSFDQAVQLSGQGEAMVTEEMAKQGIRLETTVAASTYYMGFNMLDPVVGDGGRNAKDREAARKLRQAITIAVDYEEFISIFVNGRGLAAHGPIAPGIIGHQEGQQGINPVVYDWVDGQPRRKSIEVARKLLSEAGYPNGINQKTGAPLVLYYDVTARSVDDKSKLDWMRKQFQKLNIQLVVRSTDYNRFQDKIRKGNAQIFEWGWNADYPDAENFLFLLYGPQRKVGNSGENAANYDNAEYNVLFEQMKNMENGPQRQKIIDRMVQILRNDAPWLWGFHPKDFGLYHAWYQNVKPNRISNNTLKYFKINGDSRQQKQREWNAPVIVPALVLVMLLVVASIPAITAFRCRERSAAV